MFDQDDLDGHSQFLLYVPNAVDRGGGTEGRGQGSPKRARGDSNGEKIANHKASSGTFSKEKHKVYLWVGRNSIPDNNSEQFCGMHASSPTKTISAANTSGTPGTPDNNTPRDSLDTNANANANHFALIFAEFLRSKKLDDKTVETEIVYDRQEPDAFWDYFEN